MVKGLELVHEHGRVVKGVHLQVLGVVVIRDVVETFTQVIA